MTTSSSNTSAKLSTSPATTMAELMAQHAHSLKTLKKGEEVKGTITKLSSSEIMMQLDNKTDVMVMEKERKLHKQLTTLLKIGNKVEATVIYPESDEGYPMVSLRKYMADKMWAEIENLQKSGQKLSAAVTETTKGGLLAETENGISGFLPNSHVALKNIEIGQKIQVHIAELKKDVKKVIFSQKQTLTQDDFKVLAETYKAGTKIKGRISGITVFGMFVSLPFTKDGEQTTVDGLIHISEVAWEKVEDLQSMFAVGQEVGAVVIGIDPRSKRIDLSIKRLSKDPFQQIVEAFPVDKKITGVVLEMTELGLILDLGEVDGVMVEGLIKKDKIPAATSYKKGQSVQTTVVLVDSKRRKVMLTPVLLEKPLMYR